MQFHREGIYSIGLADRKAAAPDCVVKAAHMPPDGHCLDRLEPDKPLDQIDALLPVAIGKRIGDRVARHPLPPRGLLVLDVPKTGLIEVCLA